MHPTPSRALLLGLALVTTHCAHRAPTAPPSEVLTWNLRASGESGAQLSELVAGPRDFFAIGAFSGELRRNEQTLSSAGAADVFVARFDRAGTVRWARRLGGPGHELNEALALGPDNSLIAVGSFEGRADFVGVSLQSPGEAGCFVARLSQEDGHALWARAFGGLGRMACRSAATDASGDLLVTGRFDGTVDLGSGPFHSAGHSDIFLLKLSGKDGTPLWARHFGGGGDDVGRDVAVGPTGTVYVTGEFSLGVSGDTGAADFGTGRLASAGDADAFLAALSGDGRTLWARAIGGPTVDLAKSVVVAPDGNLYLTGLFQGNVPREPGQLLFSLGGFEGFLAGYSPSGTERWRHRWPRMTSGHALTLAPSGELLLSGHFTGTLELGAHRLESAGKNDALVAGFSTEGEPRWARRFGGDGQDYGYAVAASATEVLVGGILTPPSTAGASPPPGAFISRLGYGSRP
jgi:hypothetical protein